MSKANVDEATRQRGVWGPGLCVLGCFLLAFTFMNLPPKFEKLAASDVQVTRAPYMKIKMTAWDVFNAVEDFFKGGWYRVHADQYVFPALDLDGTPTWIAYGQSHHMLPKELADVQAGDKIKVWIDVPGKTVWQVAYRNKTLMDYEDIKKQDAHWRHLFRLAAFGIFLVGLVLAVLKF